MAATRKLLPVVILAGLLAGAARAEMAPVGVRVNAISDDVTTLQKALGIPNTSSIKLKLMGQQLSDDVEGARIAVMTNFRGDFKREQNAHGDPASLDRLMTEGNERLAEGAERLLDADEPPPPSDLFQANDMANQLYQDKKIGFGRLGDSEMGVYRYIREAAKIGTVALNDVMSFVAGVVGDAMAYAVIIHEAAHARDHRDGKLSADEVIEGEVRAFKAQYDYLKTLYVYRGKDGRKYEFEEVATMHGDMIAAAKDRPGDVARAAVAFASTMNALVGTGGDLDKIRDLVKTLHYEEKSPVSAPSSPAQF